VAEQYNVSPTFLSLRDLSVYTVDSCIANNVFDTAQFDSSRQLLAAVLDSLSAVDTARYLFSMCVSHSHFRIVHPYLVVFCGTIQCE